MKSENIKPRQSLSFQTVHLSNEIDPPHGRINSESAMRTLLTWLMAFFILVLVATCAPGPALADDAGPAGTKNAVRKALTPRARPERGALSDFSGFAEAAKHPERHFPHMWAEEPTRASVHRAGALLNLGDDDWRLSVLAGLRDACGEGCASDLRLLLLTRIFEESRETTLALATRLVANEREATTWNKAARRLGDELAAYRKTLDAAPRPFVQTTGTVDAKPLWEVFLPLFKGSDEDGLKIFSRAMQLHGSGPYFDSRVAKFFFETDCSRLERAFAFVEILKALRAGLRNAPAGEASKPCAAALDAAIVRAAKHLDDHVAHVSRKLAARIGEKALRAAALEQCAFYEGYARERAFTDPSNEQSRPTREASGTP